MGWGHRQIGPMSRNGCERQCLCGHHPGFGPEIPRDKDSVRMLACFLVRFKSIGEMNSDFTYLPAL